MTNLELNQAEKVPAVGNTQVKNILSAAEEDAGFAKLLKFRKGAYFSGEEIVPLGTEFIAHAIGWIKSWIKFVDGEVVERKIYRIAMGERPPEREDLGDLDKDQWPEGIDGQPADPWSLHYLLPLEKISDGDVVIFTTSSIGGRRAVADLCAAYAKRTAKRASCGQPIVTLGTAEMPTRKFGKVLRPQFVIVGWDDPVSDFNTAPPAIASELDVSIPF